MLQETIDGSIRSMIQAVRSRGFCGALSFELHGAVLPELTPTEAPDTSGPFLLPHLGTRFFGDGRIVVLKGGQWIICGKFLCLH